MSYTVSLIKEAEDELNDAILWYEEHQKGLGNYFLIHVEVGLVTIQRNPKQFKISYRGLRISVLQRFPYSIYYAIEGENIKVKGVLHYRRNRKRILRRRK